MFAIGNVPGYVRREKNVIPKEPCKLLQHCRAGRSQARELIEAQLMHL